MVEILNRFVYPDEWMHKRTPMRPPNLQVLNFAKTYDYDTIWNDAIQIRTDTILLTGPPLYKTAQWLESNCKFLDEKGNQLTWQYSELDRACVTVVTTTEWMKELTLLTPYGPKQIKLNYASLDFGGKKVIVTISKNHPISWLQQWIDYHKVVHNLDGLLIYNNQSDIYTSAKLEKALHRNDMVIKVVDYDVPFGTMGGGNWEWEDRRGNFLPWDSDFSQYVMFEHAKWRYLHNAKLVINADTDELLTLNNDSTLDQLADYCETSSNSVWLYKGTWISPVDSRTQEIAENINLDNRQFINYWHTDNSSQRGIGIKWMLNPSRNLQYQWRLHNTTGPHLMTTDIGFGHYLAMNTSWSWKRDGYSGDFSNLIEHEILKNNLEMWYQKSEILK